jgi:hypothetical protein
MKRFSGDGVSTRQFRHRGNTIQRMRVVALIVLPLVVISVLFRNNITGWFSSHAQSTSTANPPGPRSSAMPSTEKSGAPDALPIVPPVAAPPAPKPRDLTPERAPELTTPPDPKKLSNTP